jgi:hypothetical protein
MFQKNAYVKDYRYGTKLLPIMMKKTQKFTCQQSLFMPWSKAAPYMLIWHTVLVSRSLQFPKAERYFVILIFHWNWHRTFTYRSCVSLVFCFTHAVCLMQQAGCQSIVLSGGYEDDTDNGDTFYYTGTGNAPFLKNEGPGIRLSKQFLIRIRIMVNIIIFPFFKIILSRYSSGAESGQITVPWDSDRTNIAESLRIQKIPVFRKKLFSSIWHLWG